MKKLMMLFTVALAAITSTFAATDGTMAVSAGDWNSASTWVGGVAPGGAGSVLSLFNSNTAATLYGLTNDVTLGKLVYSAENTKQSPAFAFDTSWYGTCVKTDEYPSNEGYAFGFPKMATVTFEKGAGESAAQFANLNPESVHANPNGNYLAILHPVALKSDLEVKGIGRNDANIIVQPAYAMGLLNRVTEQGGKRGLTVDVGTSTKCTDPFALYDSANDFTGDILVKRGNLRAVSTDSLEHEDSTVFGHDNAIYATNGQSSVDIADNRFGKTQHLYIGGGMPSTTYGQLFSTYSDVTYFPEWKGKVTLTSDAVIGGYPPSGSGYSSSRGNLAISGDIDDGGNGYSLTARGVWHRFVKLTGKNTYSGGTTINGCRLIAGKDSLGTGKVAFAGNGVYVYEGKDSCDIATLGFTGSPKFYVPEGVTYNPSVSLGAFSGLGKFGKGTLVLAHENKNAAGVQVTVYDGELVLDYTADQGTRYNTSQNCNLHSLSTFRVRGIPSDLKTAIGHFFGLGEAAFARFVNESTGAKFSIGRMTPGNGAVAIVETPETFLTSLGNGNATSVNPGFVSATFFCKDETWVANGGSNALVGFADFAESWTSAGVTYPVVDVKNSSASAPAGAVASCVRFNDPTATTLTLAGETTLYGGTILVTPNVGKTTVRITGGSLKTSASNKPLYIVNFNTNATVIVESPITSSGAVCAVGPGKVVFAGANTFLGNLYVNNCDLELRGQSPVGTTAVANGEKVLGFGPKARLIFGNTMTLAQAVGSGYSKISIKTGPDGARFTVPNAADTVTVTPATSNWGTIFPLVGSPNCPEGNIVFEGPGTFDWNLSGKIPVEFKVTKGAKIKTFSLGSFMHDNAGPMSLTAEEGTTLANGAFLQANGTFNGDNNGAEVRGVIPFRFGGSVTVDVAGVKSSKLAGRVEKLGRYTHHLDAWIGTGTVSIVDSKKTAGATIAPGGFRSTRFSGKLVSDIPFEGVGGLELPDVEFVAKSGVDHWFKTWSDNESVTFGALSGKGSLITRISAYNQNLNAGSGGTVFRDQKVLIGRDKANESTHFEGYLDFGQHNRPKDYVSAWNTFKERGGPRLVKTGTNSLKISCPTNWIPRSTLVRGGNLLVGGNSQPTSETGYRAVLGRAGVLIGDAETRMTDVPQLLIDGAYTVANDVNVPSISPAAALPGVGGNATCEYTGTVKLFRKTALVANGEDSVVTFDRIVGASGEDATQRAGVVVKGDGKIVVKSLEGVTDFGAVGNTAQLMVEGELNIPEGATFTYVPSAEQVKRSQSVITAKKITGSFASVTGLPGGWSVRVRSNSITVGKKSGLLLLVQ